MVRQTADNLNRLTVQVDTLTERVNEVTQRVDQVTARVDSLTTASEKYDRVLDYLLKEREDNDE